MGAAYYVVQKMWEDIADSIGEDFSTDTHWVVDLLVCILFIWFLRRVMPIITVAIIVALVVFFAYKGIIFFK